MSQRWCSLCYHQNRDKTGIISTDELNQHYESQHASIKTQWPSTRSYPVKFTINNKPYLFDDIPFQPPNASLSQSDIDMFLQHKTTPTDIINRIQYNKQYVIAWYSKPHRSSKFNYDWCISTLWSDRMHELYTETIKQLMPLYPDLISKLELEYSSIMDDTLNRTPKNISNLTFKHKTLQIIREIKRCQVWIKYFLKPVNEIADQAPNYFKIINEPMDIESLKQLIECNIIKTPKQFCSKLMLIWKNAKQFNPSTHKIHEYAVKCCNESQRLIKKYFPELCCNSNSNSNNKKYAIVQYDSNNIRQCLLCYICHSKLELFIGFHIDCSTEWNLHKNCNNCGRDLNDICIGYYHCINGCNNIESNNLHSIFICEICASNDEYNSKQIPNGYLAKDLPFNGLWIDIDKQWYEAISCYQESNRICYEIVFSSEFLTKEFPFGRTEGNIIENKNELMFEIDDNIDSTDFTIGKLNIDHSILRFIDQCDNKSENIYKKVKPKCIQCNNSDGMIFMKKNTIPSNNIASVIYCDIHVDYYEKQMNMNMENKCISFSAFKYDNLSKNKIPQIGFYFTCIKCNNFDVCAGCVLIQMEQEFNQKNEYEIHHEMEPPRKKLKDNNNMSVSVTPDIDIDIDIDINDSVNEDNLAVTPKKIISETVVKKDEKKNVNDNDDDIVVNIGMKRKRDNNNNNNNNNDEINYKELYMKEKNKNNKLVLELKESNEMSVYWKAKYNKLYSKVQGVLLNDTKTSPRKCKS